MPDKVVDVPGLGTVSFPDSMSDAEIATHIQRAIAPSNPKPEPAGFMQRLGENVVNLGQPFAHPLDTAKSLLTTLGSMASPVQPNFSGGLSVQPSPLAQAVSEDSLGANMADLGTAAAMGAIPGLAKAAKAGAEYAGPVGSVLLDRMPVLGTVRRTLKTVEALKNAINPVEGARTWTPPPTGIPRSFLHGPEEVAGMAPPPVTFRPAESGSPVAPPPVKFRPTEEAKAVAAPPVKFKPVEESKTVAAPPVKFKTQEQAPMVPPPPVKFKAQEEPAQKVYPPPPIRIKPTSEMELPEPLPEYTGRDFGSFGGEGSAAAKAHFDTINKYNNIARHVSKQGVTPDEVLALKAPNGKFVPGAEEQLNKWAKEGHPASRGPNHFNPVYFDDFVRMLKGMQ